MTAEFSTNYACIFVLTYTNVTEVLELPICEAKDDMVVDNWIPPNSETLTNSRPRDVHNIAMHAGAS